MSDLSQNQLTSSARMRENQHPTAAGEKLRCAISQASQQRTFLKTMIAMIMIPCWLSLIAVFSLLTGIANPEAVNALSTESEAAAAPIPPLSSGVRFHRAAFTPDETARIVQQMKTLPNYHDERVGQSVKRTNYFDSGSSVTNPDSPYKWIFERIQPLYAPDQTLQSFQSSIDFILMHEFDPSGFFDWHVDTKPNDGTNRIDNINVMLSSRSDYEGGTLTVGAYDVPAQQGDCYSYPASYPHKVGDITRGRRHTFIIAVKESGPEQRHDEEKYRKCAEENHRKLSEEQLPHVAKLHMLHGEFLAALGRPADEVDAKFADMYACTPEAEQYVQSFLRHGQQILQRSGISEKEKEQAAQGYFNMASMIQNRILSKQQC